MAEIQGLSKKSAAVTAVDVKQDENCPRDRDVAVDTETANNQQQISSLHSELSAVNGNVGQVLVEASPVEYSDAIDISNAVTIDSLENGTLYVLQPVESVVNSAQNSGCQTLQLLSQPSCEQDDGRMTASAVIVTTSSADVISNSADFTHFLRSAMIAGAKSKSANHSESTV